MTPNSDPLLKNVSNAIASKLGLSQDAVSVGVGEKSTSDFAAVAVTSTAPDETPTNLLIKLKIPNVEQDPKGAETKIMEALSKLPPIAAISETVPEEKQAVQITDQLKAVAQGTKFNTKLLEWSGFDPKIAKDAYNERDHAVEVDSWANSALGVNIALRIPADKDTDPKPLTTKVEENVKARIPAIRQALSERVQKYTAINMKKEGKSDADIAAAVAKVPDAIAKMEIAINKDDSWGYNNVSITLRSPEQQEAFKKNPTNENPDNADALRKTNPLSALTNTLTEAEQKANPDASTQLGKALGGAFLFAGDNAMDIFPLIAGRKDIKSAIADELAGVIANHPEKAAAAQAILGSDLFKSHDWRALPDSPETVKPPPAIVKRAENEGEVEVWVSVPKKDVGATLNALAAMGTAPQQSSGQAPAAETPPASQPVPSASTSSASANDTSENTPPKQPGWLRQALTKVVPDSLLPNSWVRAEQARKAANESQFRQTGS